MTSIVAETAGFHVVSNLLFFLSNNILVLFRVTVGQINYISQIVLHLGCIWDQHLASEVEVLCVISRRAV